MRKRLKQIYQDLSEGKLTQKEALASIRALKLPRQEKISGILLASPRWEKGTLSMPSSANRVEFSERHIILCELPHAHIKRVEISIPDSRCWSWQPSPLKNVAERFIEVAQACFEFIKKTLSSRPSGNVLVQIVVANQAESALFTALSGLLKTAELENPHITGQVILTTPGISSEELVMRLQADKTRHSDKIIKYEKGTRHVLRLQEVSARLKAPNVVFKDQGVYLITGGLGGLGILFAQEIIKQTSNAKIVLAGWSALISEKKKMLEALSAQRASVEYQPVDITDLDQVKQLIAAIKNEHKQLNGIIHAAGIHIDNFILKKTSEEFRRVLLPKVTGTFNLDQASRDIDLDFMVLFSSVASWVGNSGQADYATANGFMDHFAVYRNSLVETKERKGKTLSINWPLWQEGGMRMDSATQKMLEKTTGLQALSTATGLLTFHHSLELPPGQIMVMDGDYAQMRSGLLENPTKDQQVLPAVKTPANGTDVTGLFEKTQGFIGQQLALQLKIAVHQLDPKAPLEDYGIDSILALSLVSELEGTFGALPKTLFFEYQTIDELTGYFIELYADTLRAILTTKDNGHRRLRPSVGVAKLSPLAASRQITGSRFISQGPERGCVGTNQGDHRHDPIAIVGLSGRYAEAVDIQEYWHNLRDGRDCIVEVPQARWDWRAYYTEDRTKEGHHYSKWGGFIAGVDEFDPRFFNISPREAPFIDPQERLFLQHAWMAVEDAGYTRSSLQIPHADDLAGQVGVYVGLMYSEYQLFGNEASLRGKRMSIGGSYASIANRVSYVLNLHGPSMTLDTMCSSSLTAVHIACQDLKLGRTSLAIAGGVNVSIHPNKYLFLSAGQFISGDGHCQSFGQGGGGYIPGEGVGVVILKRLSEAVREGNHIYGIIKGSALNHGGKTNGYSVPNPKAQTSMISSALAESKTDARHISYIEAHGTGTKLGDPIEIAALSKAFQQHTQEKGFCLIGSAKSNIGHCESAAGIAGLTKVLLQMKYEQIVPSLHSQVLNPYIDFQQTPFVVNQTLRSWDQPVIEGQRVARIAGISSFGAGGANAHLIVEEYVPPSGGNTAVMVVSSDAETMISLSARTADQLKQKAIELLGFIRASPPELRAMGYTLQVGREALEERVGFIVSSLDELAEKLEGYIDGGLAIENFFQGQVKGNKEALSLFSADVDLRQTVDQWIGQKRLSKLLDWWVKGLEVDWNKLYANGKPSLISLPTYPFAKEQYWIDTEDTVPLVSAPTATAVLHPLLHLNTSDLMQHSYCSTFSGKECFFTDHQGNADRRGGQKALLKVAYLEMARVAVEKALLTQQKSSITELRQVVWGPPFVITENGQITVVLFAKDHDQVDFEIYSEDQGEDVVHCQGQAIFIPKPTQTKLDIEQLKQQKEQGVNQLVAEIQGPVTSENRLGDYMLHPTLIDNALHASIGLISNQLSLPFALDSIRVVSACPQEMFVWSRYSQGSQSEDITTKLDMDLCDPQGNICVQMRGVSYQQESPEANVQVSTQTNSPATPPVPKQIPLTPQVTAPEKISISEPLLTIGGVATKKTNGISLVTPGDLALETDATSVGKALVVLSNTSVVSVQEHQVTAASLVSLYDYGNGLYLIQITAARHNTLSPDVIQQLVQALHRVQQEPSVKVVMLSGTAPGFLRGGRKEYNVAIEQKLFHTVASFPYPVIAALQGDATGVGFLVGALCDFMICSQEGNYSYTVPQEGLYPTAEEYQLFKERLGEVQATDFLYHSTVSTGQQLREKGWTCPILPKEQVEEYAQRLASTLAKKSKASLHLLKQHLARRIIDPVKALAWVNPSTGEEQPAKAHHSDTSSAKHNQSETYEENILVVIREKVKNLPSWLEVKEEASRPLSATPVSIALESKVITATAHPEGILVVKMEDREAKNMFSEAFSQGMTEVFEHIEQVPEYKVVVLTGYATYFASGGTKETLLSIQEGKTNFTDNKIYQIAMTCQLPVIAAMQGHAVGAGWAMGMFADFVLLSEESKYVSPYMNYGFTPGAGATFIFPEKIGHDLARETLLTAQEYGGSELKARGLSLPVLPRREVYPTAMALAKQIANYSRRTLIASKQQLTAPLYKQIEETYKLELAMHEKTFVGQSDTLQQINDNFHWGGSDSQEEPDVLEKATPVTTLPPTDTTRATLSQDPDILSTVTVSIKKFLADELHLREDEIDEHTQFIDLGLDSITGVTWIRKINEQYKTSIEATKIYSYPTLVQLSRFVKEEAEKVGTVSSKSALNHKGVSDNDFLDNAALRVESKIIAQSSVKKLTSWRNRSVLKPTRTICPANPSQSIAVVGMAGQFPEAKNLNEFWQNIAEGKSCISEIPPERWDINTYYHEGKPLPGKTNSKWAGLLEEYDLFDPLFFNISPTEAESMDPQQRVLLQACWHSIEQAGYNPRTLSGSKCGVYIGCASGDYHLLSRELQIGAQGFTGGATSILAARISYLLNLRGPCLSIDTACSSSLVAIATACDSLISGNSDLALAGGVYVMVGPDMHIKSSQSGMLSRDGKCYAFDNRANGFVPGEGVGVVMLKRLSDAERDNDKIYGVIQGWDVNQDGKTNGITAPNEESQTRLEQNVYEKFQIDPNGIQLIEAHGTGTKLGDPIEVSALKEAFKKYTTKKEYCALGSVKSNIGHCLTASGVASFIKTLLALHHKQLPPTINYHQLNEHIGLKDSAFYINDRLREWEVAEAARRQAAISAFGFSGTNAHIVLAEYEPSVATKRPVSVITQNSKVIVPLSARTADQLTQKARDLLGFIRNKKPSIDLVEMAYTLQVGREAMGERLGFLVSSIEQLAEKLQAYVDGEKDIQDRYQGPAKNNRESLSFINRDDDLKEIIIKTWINQQKLSKLIDLWAKGIELDWNRLYGEVKPQRISLPTYPFAKERYWFEETESVPDLKTEATLSVLHPLLHKNVSDLNQQCYSSIFSGEEFFIKDHHINGNKVLSALATIEMAHAAVVLATSTRQESTVVELHNLLWTRPMVVTKNKEVEIALFANDGEDRLQELIDFEIYSTEAEQKIIHFQGQAFPDLQPEPAKLDIAQLKGQMGQGTLESKSIYEGFAKMGLTYGPTHQGIKTIYQGDNQLLAELSLPGFGKNNQSEFILHPTIMEGTLQACVCLITDLNQPLNGPLFPDSLDSVRIASACTKDMVAWIRCKNVGSSNQRLDIDLMDQQGNVGVQLRGLSLDRFTINTDNPENTQKLPDAKKATYSHSVSQLPEASQQLFFQEYWQDQPLTSGVLLLEGKQIIIFTDEEFQEKIANSDEADQLTEAIFVYQAERYRPMSDNVYQCRFDNVTDIQTVLNEVSNKSNQPMTLIYTWAKDQKEAGIHVLFDLFKAIKEFNHHLVEVTLVGHYDLLSSDSCWDYSWIGFERSLRLVLPNVRISLLYTNSSAYTPQQLLDVVQHGGVIWYKDERRFTLSFKRYEPSITTQKSVLKKNGSYLITGGCGELGFRFAHYLAKEYQAKLLLLGRSTLTSSIQEQADRLKQAGAQEVHYQAVDISNREALTSWVQQLPFSLSGIIHAAGVESTQAFYEKTTDDINEVLHPKSIGTILLDELLDQQPLDFVCYFSSSAALLGDIGSCDYAIANRFQMAYAYYRQQKRPDNGKSMVINWPFWQDGGMGKSDPEQTAFYLKSSGQNALETSKGIGIWHDIIRSNQMQTLVMNGKPSHVEQFLHRIYEAEQQGQTILNVQSMPAHSSKGWKIQYQDLSLKECVFSDLIKLVSTSLKIPSEKLDGTTNLADYGFNSISLAAFAELLKDHFSLDITPALFFNYSTVEKLSNYFVRDHHTHLQEFYCKPQREGYDKNSIAETRSIKMKPSLRKRLLPTPSKGRSYAASIKQEPIAIIGMSGRFPQADTVDQLWTLLEKGESGISEIPSSRWDWRDYFTVPGDSSNKISTNKGGFINHVDEFDPLFFEISPREAEATDPGQRLLLMEAYKAIEDAQIDPSSLRGSPVGVFVGMEESQYDPLVVDEQGVGNSGNAMISSRLSYYLDLHGPTIAINTACSSGLVALHQAIMSLRHGECSSALVAGISSFILSPTFYVKMSQAGMLSEDGQCYSFARKANGISAGEAVVVLMLKPLSAAVAAGNPIYGTIKASGINFDGKTNGVTAPSGKRQEELIKSVYTNYHINPADVSHIVAHGTGTKLGDPIELNALNEAFKKLTKERSHATPDRRCAITSCKSNVGHTMAASGLVSVVSLLKGLQHNKIPASLHCEDENNYIEWGESPFYINKTTKEWEREIDKPRMGGVSAFGRSGTNAHVIVEEYVLPIAAHPSAVTLPGDDTQVIIPLSARTVEQLQQRARELLDFIMTPDQNKESVEEPTASSETINLIALAYSLQVTREAMKLRLGFIVSSIDQLVDKLQSYLNAEKNIDGTYQGEVKRYNTSVSLFNVDADLQETIDKWIANKKLSKLLDFWVSGLELNWNKLYGKVKPQRISLPKYPFAKERYWIDRTGSNQVTENTSLINRNHESIEAIINKVDDELIETNQAVELLKKVVYLN